MMKVPLSIEVPTSGAPLDSSVKGGASVLAASGAAAGGVASGAAAVSPTQVSPHFSPQPTALLPQPSPPASVVCKYGKDATAMVGTAQYMAPEAALPGYDEKVDIYAAAVVSATGPNRRVSSAVHCCCVLLLCATADGPVRWVPLSPQTFFELFEATDGPHGGWRAFNKKSGFLLFKTPAPIGVLLKRMGSVDPATRPTAKELVKAFTDTGLAKPNSRGASLGQMLAGCWRRPPASGGSGGGAR